MSSLAELGEIAKAYDDARPDDSHTGRRVAGAGLGLWGAGQASMMSGIHSAAKESGKHALDPSQISTKGLKRIGAGLGASSVGTGAILAGGGIGAHNMYRKSQRLKHERAMELERARRGQ